MELSAAVSEGRPCGRLGAAAEANLAARDAAVAAAEASTVEERARIQEVLTDLQDLEDQIVPGP